MHSFWRRLFGRDGTTKRMYALFRISKARNDLRAILAMGIIEKSFDRDLEILRKQLDDFCERLTEAVTYNDWWNDWDVAIEKQRAALAAAASERLKRQVANYATLRLTA